jgi:hypothetical protein
MRRRAPREDQARTSWRGQAAEDASRAGRGEGEPAGARRGRTRAAWLMSDWAAPPRGRDRRSFARHVISTLPASVDGRTRIPNSVQKARWMLGAIRVACGQMRSCPRINDCKVAPASFGRKCAMDGTKWSNFRRRRDGGRDASTGQARLTLNGLRPRITVTLERPPPGSAPHAARGHPACESPQVTAMLRCQAPGGWSCSPGQSWLGSGEEEWARRGQAGTTSGRCPRNLNSAPAGPQPRHSVILRRNWSRWSRITRRNEFFWAGCVFGPR